MGDDTVDGLDREQLTTDVAGVEPLIGFELTLSADEPAECTLFLVETDGTANENAWVRAKEGSFADLDASR